MAGPPCGCEEETQLIVLYQGVLQRRCAKPPAGEEKPGTRVVGGERDEPRRDGKSLTSVSPSRRNSSVEPDQSRRGTATTSAEAGDESRQPEGGAAGFRARILCTAAARPERLGEPRRQRRGPAAGVVVALALFARVASTPPDVGDDDDVSAASGCCTTRDCAHRSSSSSSVTRGALLAAFFALRENILKSRILRSARDSTAALAAVRAFSSRG